MKTQADSGTAALPDITRDLNTSNVIADLSSSLDCAGVAATAVLWSFLTRYNQKSVLLSSLGLVAAFAFGGAIAPSIAVLLVMRFLSSAAAAGIIVTGVDIVDKLWPVHRKGLAIGLFFIGPQACPALGPVVGGLLTTRWGWRSLQYLQASWSAAMFVMVVLFLPASPKSPEEPNARLEEKLTKLKGVAPGFGQPRQLVGYLFVSEHEQHIFSVSKLLVACRNTFKELIASLRVFGLLRHRLIAILLYIAGFSFAESSCFLVAVQSQYSSAPYSYGSLRISMMYLPYAVGSIAASIGGGKWSDKIMHNMATQRTLRRKASIETPRDEIYGEEYFPEDRLGINAWISVACLPVALGAFGWILYQQPYWFFPVCFAKPSSENTLTCHS